MPPEDQRSHLLAAFRLQIRNVAPKSAEEPSFRMFDFLAVLSVSFRHP